MCVYVLVQIHQPLHNVITFTAMAYGWAWRMRIRMTARRKLSEEGDDSLDSMMAAKGDASVVSFEDTAPLTGPTYSTNVH